MCVGLEETGPARGRGAFLADSLARVRFRAARVEV